MKKLICVALCFVCVVSCFCGCSKTDNNVTEQNSVVDINEPGTEKAASEKKVVEEVTYFKQEEPEENPRITTSYLIHQKFPQLPDKCNYYYTISDIDIYDPGDETKTDIIPAYSYFPVGTAYFYNDNPDLDVYEFYTVKNNKLYKINQNEKFDRKYIQCSFDSASKMFVINEDVVIYDRPHGKATGTAKAGTYAISDIHIDGYYSMNSKEYGLYWIPDNITTEHSENKKDATVIRAGGPLYDIDKYIGLPSVCFNSMDEFYDQFYISETSGSVRIVSKDPSNPDNFEDCWEIPQYYAYANYYLNDGPEKH